jgi:hypothetical protein
MASTLGSGDDGTTIHPTRKGANQLNTGGHI